MFKLTKYHKKTKLFLAGFFLVAILPLLVIVLQQRQTITQRAQVAQTVNMQVSYYSYPENDPPGAGITYLIKHQEAGGTGTYDDPVTFATKKDAFPPGTIVYVPYIQKYAILEDDCASCNETWIDLWMTSDANSGDAVIACVNQWSVESTPVELNPPADRPVFSAPLFDPVSKTCVQSITSGATQAPTSAVPPGNIVPSMVCLGNCPTTAPTMIPPIASLPVNASPISNPLPTVPDSKTIPESNCIPVEVNANSGNQNEANRRHKKRGRGRHGDRENFSGIIQIIMDFINQLMQMLMQLLGISAGGGGGGINPNPTSGGANPTSILPPCPTTAPSSGQPSQTQPTTGVVPTSTVPTTAGSIAPTAPGASTAPVQNGNFSLLFYPGWTQANLPPDQIDYTAWTHIMHFGMFPDDSGNVIIAEMGSASYPAPAIAAAHAAGKKIILSVGGAGTGPQFANSTTTANRAKFIQSIVSTMTQYGYDGVDMDWEENFTEEPYVALMQGLRTELDKISPRPILTTDVDHDLNPPAIVAKVAQYADMIILMSYWDNGQAMYNAFANAGIPANKMVFGMGMTGEFVDKTAAEVTAKINFAKQQGMLGMMTWEAAALNTAQTDPRLVPLRNYVAGQ